MKGETGIVFLFYSWRTARPGIEYTEGTLFCTFLHKLWKGVVAGERRDDVCGSEFNKDSSGGTAPRDL